MNDRHYELLKDHIWDGLVMVKDVEEERGGEKERQSHLFFNVHHKITYNLSVIDFYRKFQFTCLCTNYTVVPYFSKNMIVPIFQIFGKSHFATWVVKCEWHRFWWHAYLTLAWGELGRSSVFMVFTIYNFEQKYKQVITSWVVFCFFW